MNRHYIVEIEVYLYKVQKLTLRNANREIEEYLIQGNLKCRHEISLAFVYVYVLRVRERIL